MNSQSHIVRRLTILAISVGLVAVALLWWASPSQALPNYGSKTGQACGGCHLNPSGAGPLTAKGQAFAAIATRASDPAGAWAQAAGAPAGASEARAPAPAAPGGASTAAGKRTSLTMSPALEVEGAPIKLTASLKDDTGSPIGKATVRFYIMDAEFAATKGDMEIGAARTDADGVAAISYKPTVTGNQRVKARFEGMGAYGETEQAMQLVVRQAEPAYEVAPRGLEALTDWAPRALVLALLIIWSIFGYVLYQVYRIRKANT